MPKYAGLRALLGPCMNGVDDPFSDEGERIVYMRFSAAAQIVITDYLAGLIEKQAATELHEKLIEEIIECAFDGLYDKVRTEAEDQ
jgi:hypothetical protein